MAFQNSNASRMKLVVKYIFVLLFGNCFATKPGIFDPLQIANDIKWTPDQIEAMQEDEPGQKVMILLHFDPSIFSSASVPRRAGLFLKYGQPMWLSVLHCVMICLSCF